MIAACLGVATVVCVVGQLLPRVALVTDRAYLRWAFVPALLLGAAAWFGGRSWQEDLLLSGMAGLAGVLVVVDLVEHRLPDTVLLAAAGLWLGGTVVLSALTGTWAAFGGTLAGGSVGFVAFLLLALAARGMLGFGDVKLAALLGAVLGWYGWRALVVGFAAGVLIHGLVALVVLAKTRDPKADVPMGPALIAGTAVGIAAAGWIG